MVSQAKPHDKYHYDCTYCGQCSDNTLNREAYPYFYIDGHPYCPQCYPAAIEYHKEEIERNNTELVQE